MRPQGIDLTYFVLAQLYELVPYPLISPSCPHASPGLPVNAALLRLSRKQALESHLSFVATTLCRSLSLMWSLVLSNRRCDFAEELSCYKLEKVVTSYLHRLHDRCSETGPIVSPAENLGQGYGSEVLRKQWTTLLPQPFRHRCNGKGRRHAVAAAAPWSVCALPLQALCTPPAPLHVSLPTIDGVLFAGLIGRLASL